MPGSIRYKVRRLRVRSKRSKGGSMLGRFAVPAGLLVLQKMMHGRTKKSKSYKRSKTMRKKNTKRK